MELYVYYCRFKECQLTQFTQFTCAKDDSLPLLSSFSVSASPTLQGTAADRFFHSLSTFIQGLDTKNNVKVSTLTRAHTGYTTARGAAGHRQAFLAKFLNNAAVIPM